MWQISADMKIPVRGGRCNDDKCICTVLYIFLPLPANFWKIKSRVFACSQIPSRNRDLTFFFFPKIRLLEFLLWLSGLRTRLVSMSMPVGSLALLSGLRIWWCYKPWHRLQMRLAARTWYCCGCGTGQQLQLQLTPRLGTSICHMYGPKN